MSNFTAESRQEDKKGHNGTQKDKNVWHFVWHFSENVWHFLQRVYRFAE